MAQYAVLIYANDPADAADANAEGGDPHDQHVQELIGSGAVVAAFALEPAETATSIRGDVITDGPFVDAKEIVAGVYFIEAPDLDAALAIARRNPAIQEGGGLEVRPVAGGYVRPTVEG